MNTLFVLVALFIALGVLIQLGVLFLPYFKPPESQTEARAGTSQLAAAVKSYFTEYGQWPDFTGDGKFLDAERNARLMQVLTARDNENNPRRITFFEAKIAIPHSTAGNRLSAGFDPATGTFLDPWGNPYRIIVDLDDSDLITSPFPRDPVPKIKSKVIVWSLGKDGKQGAPGNEQTSHGSDDIRSWQ